MLVLAMGRLRDGAMRSRKPGATDPGERTVSGDHGGRETPVPIPNTEVKAVSADGTWGATPWESRTSPEFFRPRAPANAGALLIPGLERVDPGQTCSTVGCATSMVLVLGASFRALRRNSGGGGENV